MSKLVSDMATTYDEERILQQLHHLNDSQRIFDFLFNSNRSPEVSVYDSKLMKRKANPLEAYNLHKPTLVYIKMIPVWFSTSQVQFL